METNKRSSKMKNVISIISPQNNRPSSDELKAMIKSTKGRFFSCVTLKSDGSYRKWVARTGVKKGVKGVGRKNRNRISNVIIPCLIVGLCKMLIVIVVMIIICLLMAKVE